MDLQNLIETLVENGDVSSVARNTRAQFGTPARRYLGATLLPERDQTANEYDETEVRFRTVVANDGTRYSPVQIKDAGAMVGSLHVELWNKDIGREFSARDYDGLTQLLGRNMTMQGMVQLIRWLDTAVNVALIEKDEIQRWEALLTSKVVRTGDNGYIETVYFSNPTGHRVAATNPWSDPTYDPWPDITGMAQTMYNKGYNINRIVTSRFVVSILAANPKIAARINAAPLVVGAGGVVTQILPGARVSLASINAALGADGLPPFETYDLTYNTQTETKRFFPQDAMFMAATTGRDEEIMVDFTDETILVQNTLGYTGVGLATGQPTAGRRLLMQAFEDKPPRIEGSGWETTAPVILDPEAMVVITGIS